MPRTAGDTWDIVTSVGFTALAVCCSACPRCRARPPLANDDFPAGFVTAAGKPNLIAAVTNTDTTSAAAFNGHWVGVRTRFFDHFFTRAGQSGSRQAVILGGRIGLPRIPMGWPSDYAVFEVDQPRVLEFKQHVLYRQGAVPSTLRVTIATDLRKDWWARSSRRASIPTNRRRERSRACCRIRLALPRTRCSRGCTSCRL